MTASAPAGPPLPPRSRPRRAASCSTPPRCPGASGSATSGRSPSRSSTGRRGPGSATLAGPAARPDRRSAIRPTAPPSAFAGHPLLISPDRLVEDGLLAGAALDGAPVFPDRAGRLRGPSALEGPGLLRASFERARGRGPMLRALCRPSAPPRASGSPTGRSSARSSGKSAAAWHEWPSGTAAAPARRAGGGPPRAARGDRVRRVRPVPVRRPVASGCARAARERWVGCSATCRSTSPTTSPTSGRDRNSSFSTPRVVRTWSPVFLPTPSARTASSGAIRSTTGGATNASASPGGSPGCVLSCARFDLVRLDHFRGVAAYWEVPADAESAKSGRWRKGPGAKLLRAVQAALDPDRTGLPICAEDLGVITADVEALRLQFDLPGMKVLQFGLGGPEPDSLHAPPHEPHAATRDLHRHARQRHRRGLVSDPRRTAREWVLDAVGHGEEWLSWKLIRMAYASVGELAMVPLQDCRRPGLRGAA